MLRYKCPKQPKADNKGAFGYHKMNIICRMVWTSTFNHLKRFISIVGIDVFVQNMFEKDSLGWTPMGYALMGKKIKVIEYLLSFELIRQKYLSDNLNLYCIVEDMNQFIAYKDTIQCAVKSLGLTEARLEELQSVYNIDISNVAKFTK